MKRYELGCKVKYEQFLATLFFNSENGDIIFVRIRTVTVDIRG